MSTAPARLTLFASILGLIAACGEAPQQAPQAEPEAQEAGAAAVDAARLSAADSDGANWMNVGRTYSEQRYSPLKQVNERSVKNLKLAWYVDLNEKRGIEATALVVDGVMYTTSAWSVVYAIDAKSGEVLWVHDPEVPKEWGVYTCCDVVNRGAAVWDGKVFVGTIDGRLVALDAATGAVVWDVNTIDRTKPYAITGAPRVVNGKVVIGNGGADYGVRGYVTAYDAQTGEQAWRFYTVPGNPAEGFESVALAEASKTWNGEWWALGGGGTVWDAMAFDPELNLLYIGVGNGSPWNQQIRSPGGGDNLFLSSVVALNADTGEYVWHYQTTPGETWDYTATQSIVLADLTIKGEARKVLMQAPKNGFFYVIDRATGEFISAEPYVPVTWASHIDPETGRPVENEEARFKGAPAVVSPGPYGGHNWQAMAFSPKTGLAYIPAMEMSSLFVADDPYVVYEGRYNTGSNLTLASLPDDEALRKAAKPLLKGHLSAWDPVAQKEAWRVQYDIPWNSGLLTTAGNLVFQGTARAQVKAYNAGTGEELWSHPAQTGVIAAPMTYEIDGEQYVSVMAGWGGAFGLTAAYFAPDETKHHVSRVLTFKLGGKAELPPHERPEAQPPTPPDQVASLETTQRGRVVYLRFCQFCHGDAAVSTGVVRDIRYSGMLGDASLWNEVVREGALAENGMANFSAQVSLEDSEAIRHYIIRRAHETKAEMEAAAGGE